jgi:hypothetical protein
MRSNFLGECFLIAAVEHSQQALVLAVEAATRIVIYCVDTALELTERRRVAERGTMTG